MFVDYIDDLYHSYDYCYCFTLAFAFMNMIIQYDIDQFLFCLWSHLERWWESCHQSCVAGTCSLVQVGEGGERRKMACLDHLTSFSAFPVLLSQ